MLNLFKKKSEGEKVTLKIEGMHCPSCAMNIDGALEDIDGVIEAQTSYAGSKVEISFDPKKIEKQSLIDVIKKEGYQVG